MGPLSGRRSASVSRRQARETTQMGQTGHAMQAECRADPDLQRSLSGTVAVRRLVIRDAKGWITGEIQGTPSFKEGKVERVEQWLLAQGLRWQDVEMTFYSDSVNDLPLLEMAQHPVATNPDAPLRQLASQRGWRILELFS